MNILKFSYGKWVRGMANNFVFEDYSIYVKNYIEKQCQIALKEAAGEILSAVKRNTRVGKSKGGGTRNSWEVRINEAEKRADIGSKSKNAIWEEFGTGEYAAETGHTGRAGYWIYVKDSSGEGKPDQPLNKTYTLEEAKRVMAIMRSKGLDAYYTKGKRPSRALFNAFNSKKKTVKKIFEKHLGG